MAKLSMINKNERRKALVVKYAGKYAVLKAIANAHFPDASHSTARDSCIAHVLHEHLR